MHAWVGCVAQIRVLACVMCDVGCPGEESPGRPQGDKEASQLDEEAAVWVWQMQAGPRVHQVVLHISRREAMKVGFFALEALIQDACIYRMR